MTDASTQSGSETAGDRFSWKQRLLPGLVLTAGVAAAAYAIRQVPFAAIASPLIIAILLGFVVRNTVGIPERFQPGIQFASKTLLRLAIILLGLQLTLGDLVAIGPSTLVMLVVVVPATLLVTMVIGKAMRIDSGLALLLGMGTAICGASAIAATASTAKASNEDVAYALICITLLGTIAMLLYPMASPLLGFDAMQSAVWSGASIHEIAQVAGATFELDGLAAETGMAVKLARVILLGPVILLAGAVLRAGNPQDGRGMTAKQLLPGFILLFLAVTCLNSFMDLPNNVRGDAAIISGFLMTMALGAFGLNADFRRLRLKGLRPLALGLIATLFIGCVTLFWIKLVGQ